MNKNKARMGVESDMGEDFSEGDIEFSVIN
jgi:hypothetical protein